MIKILCPICLKELNKIGNTYTCECRHSFDIARQGYLNLNTGRKNSGDSKKMNIARNLFLNTDAYKFLKEEINQFINNIKPSTLLDLGCGTGYYTKDFEVENKIGIDLSKSALKIASNNDKNTLYLLTNIFSLPLKDNSIDIITNLFVPLAKDEIKRVLKENGYLIYFRPDVNHLIELKKILYKDIQLNILEEIKIEGMKLINEYSINKVTNLNNKDLNNLFAMTPYFYHTKKEDFKKLSSIDNQEVSFEFLISIYQKVE